MNKGVIVSLEKVKTELEKGLPPGWTLVSLDEGIMPPHEGSLPFYHGTFERPDNSQLTFILKAKVEVPPANKVLLRECENCQLFVDELIGEADRDGLADSMTLVVANLSSFVYSRAVPTLPPPFPHPPLGGAPPIPKLPPPELAMPYGVPDQGCLLQCPYCEYVRSAGPSCPLCKGGGSYFHQAQMMDRNSSFRKIVESLREILEAEDEAGGPRDKESAKILRRRYIALLEMLVTYTFSAKDFVVERLKEIESQFELD